ncbi:MarR family winged helix-turn-helix transcriptional regulator [Rheinheimera fenheensis]|uniref:MarR family winged helix-turn-helix transcriptional regulator n=1 Tax=Rheinheimera fenheensis TaxID=3152295 RepID=UPI0029CE4DF5|nr:MarR family transcriptional regulator [Chromatiaceae bacterium]
MRNLLHCKKTNETAMMSKTLPLEEQICFALYSASNAMVRLYRPLLQPFDLTYPQYVVLLALWQQDNISLGELGNKTLFDSGTLTPLVKKLEQKGWLRRLPSPDDERVKKVVLTDEGKALEQQVAGVTAALRCQISLNDERMIQLRSLARQVQLDIQRLEQCGPG